jgi:hypothetical protein
MDKAKVLLAAGIFTPGATTLEKIKSLEPYFSPSFSQELLVNTDPTKRKRNVHPRDLKGYVTISPPKDYCFFVSKRPNLPQKKICHTTKFKFTPEDLDDNGQFRLFVASRHYKEPVSIKWKTPYRLASFIKPGKRQPEETYISECTTFYSREKYPMAKVVLITGDKWIIKFPTKHENSFYKGDFNPKFEGLFLRKSKGRSTIGKIAESITNEESKDENTGPQIDERYAKYKVNRKDLKKGEVATEPVQLYWTIAAHGSFKMDASNFQSDDGKSPRKGTCRYRFKGAGGEPKTGAIECHDTAEYDVVYAKLPCLNAFATD